MARGKKTGGRNFPKGSGGRPKGTKDKFPRGSVKAIYVGLAHEQPELLGAAIVRGLKAKPPFSFAYLQLGASYIDGKPTETVRMHVDLTKLSDEEFQQLETLLARAAKS